jgi:Protein of unknown function (DUF4232)
VTTPAPTPTPTPPPPIASTASSTPAPAPSTSAPSTSASSSGAAPPTKPAQLKSTCTSITVRVIRGSASAGQELAALQFVNAGPRSCTLVGFPDVSLLLKGRTVGRPSQPATNGTSTRTLAPGDIAESLLHDYTSCQAPLSDNLRVVVPGSTITAVRPAQLRACVLRVARLGPPE